MPRSKNLIPYTTADAKQSWRNGTRARISRFEAEPVVDPKPFRCPVCRGKVAAQPTEAKPCIECGGY